MRSFSVHHDAVAVHVGYRGKIDKNSTGKPCPRRGRTIEKFQYLGGVCYYCPECQS